MTITIITVAYNSAHTIANTLQCIQNQSYNKIEHIVVDGNSSDNTFNIINNYPHVSQTISEPDNGVYFAMNKGLEMAQGDIIGILNSDDIYATPYIIEKVAAFFMSSDIDGVYGDLDYINNKNKVVRNWRSGAYSRNKFLQGWMPPHPTFFVRKSVYDKFGGFNTNLKNSADYELMLRLMYKHKIKMGYIPEVMVKMKTGGLSNANFFNRVRANKEDKLAWGINGLKPSLYFRWVKPIRKLLQFKIF